MSTLVDRAAESAPSGRNYQKEIDLLLAQADAARSEAESIDLDSAVEASLARSGEFSLSAHARAHESAARASEKVSHT